MQQQTLASMLSPLGMTSPRTVRELDSTLDKLVAIKERNPTSPYVDRPIRAIGKMICNVMLRDAEVPILANTPQPAAAEPTEPTELEFEVDFACAA